MLTRPLIGIEFDYLRNDVLEKDSLILDRTEHVIIQNQIWCKVRDAGGIPFIRNQIMNVMVRARA